MTQKHTPKNKEEAAQIIDHYFSISHYPQVTEVEMKDGTVHHGYFQMFINDDELKSKFQYRFVSVKNFIPFREHFGDTGELNPRYTTIINAEDIASIEATIPSGTI
jgi:hypothetical protein